jgi:hypothetical protein
MAYEERHRKPTVLHFLGRQSAPNLTSGTPLCAQLSHNGLWFLDNVKDLSYT